MLEEIFKDIVSVKDKQKFIDIVKKDAIYDIINKYDEEDKIDAIYFIDEKAKLVKATKYWKEKSQLKIKRESSKRTKTEMRMSDFKDQPINLYTGSWIANEREGIVKYKGEQEIRIGYQPILITKRLIDIESDIEKFEIAFYDRGEWRRRIIPRTMLSSNNSIIKLVNYGIDVASSTANALSSYLNDLSILNKDVIPIKKSMSHLGWVDDNFNQFIPYVCKDIDCDVEGELKNTYLCFREHGSFEKWLEQVKKARKNFNIKIYMAASFASPLIKILDINGFITHLFGDRGKGKTVSLMLAMSIWGNPDNGKLTNSINNTMFALECKAEFLQNLPFSGDELLNINKKEMNNDDLIYLASNGSGKTRGDADYSVKKQKTWKLIMMTNGENSITNDNSHSGSKVRCIEIENNEEMYEGINLMEFSETIKKNYGFAGKKFIEYVISIGPEEIRKRFLNIKNEAIENSDKKYDAKQLNAICSLKLSNDLVCECIFEDEEKIELSEFLTLVKDEDEISVAERSKQYIISEISAERNAFDTKETPEGIYRGRIRGKIEFNICYIILNDLKDMLKKGGFNFNEVKEKWLKMGFLIPYKSKKKYYNSDSKYGTLVKLKLYDDDTIDLENSELPPF